MPGLFDVPPPLLSAPSTTAHQRAVEAFLFAVVVGLPDGALGVLWPSLRADLGRPVGDLGTLVAAATVPYLVASACAGVVARRFGYAGPVRLATAAAAVVLAGWALAPGWPAVLATMAALGGARGAVDGAVNVDAGVAGDTRRLGAVHASYGVGATVGPLLVAPLVAGGDAGWRSGVAALCALTTAAAIAAMVATGRARPTGRAPAGAGGSTAGGAHPSADPPAGGPFPRGLVALLLATFFAYTGVEVATGVWAFTVLTDERGVGHGPAGLLVAAYFGALTVARVALAVAGRRVPPAATLRACVALVLAGSAVLAADPLGLGPAGLVAMGAALGPVFPLAVAFVGRALGARRATVVIGWCIAFAGTGGPVVTAIAGRAADRAGLGAVPPTLAAAAAVLAAVTVAVTAAGRR